MLMFSLRGVFDGVCLTFFVSVLAAGTAKGRKADDNTSIYSNPAKPSRCV